MAFNLTQTTKNLSSQLQIKPVIILEIDGIPITFGTDVVTRKWFFDEDPIQLFDDDLLFDGVVSDPNSRGYIQENGTTTRLTSQVEIEEGGRGSVSKFNVNLVDKDQEISRILTPGAFVSDPLSREANMYIAFQGGAHPQDSVRIFTGVVTSIKSGAGSISIAISHPDELKRQSIFQQITTTILDSTALLSGNITAAITTIPITDSSQFTGLDLKPPFYISIEDEVILVGAISGDTFTGCTRGAKGTGAATHNINEEIKYSIQDDTVSIRLADIEGFLTPADTVRTYIQLEDEIIEYTSIDSSEIEGLTRASLNTILVPHEGDASLKTFYSMGGDPLTLALKMMMSNREEPMVDGLVPTFNQMTPTENIPDTIFIEEIGFLDRYGIEKGELVTITGATNPSNNVTDAVIVNTESTFSGVRLTLDQPLVTEIGSSASFSIRSQYDVFNSGLGMSHSQVDVKQHQDLLELYNTQMPNYDFYLKDTVQAKDFIAEELYFPAGLYSLIRKGRSSVQMTAPPLNSGELVTLDSTNVMNPDSIKPERSTNKYFYNNITYRYNEDSLDDKFLTGNITLSARSSDRIKLGNKVLQIDSKGLRNSADTTQFIVRQARRFTERFQFAAEKIVVETNFKTGFNIEVGDAVLFGDSNLQIYDTTSGTRDFKPRLMEVINKSFKIMGAQVTLTLLDTAFSSDARYGTVSPNSYIDIGSTTTELKLKNSFGTSGFSVERDKWESLLGEKIKIRDEDYTFSEITTLIGFDQGDETKILIYPALSISPPENYLVDIPRYDEGSDKVKSIHCFTMPQVSIISGVSESEFVVDNADIDKFFIGGFIRVHNELFTVDSTPTLENDDLEILDIQGDNITVNRDMGFIPTSSEFASLVGFASDKGVPYRFT